MNEQERIQADKLDDYINRRQAGAPQTEPTCLTDALIDLAHATRPDPAFADRLKARLHANAQHLLAEQRRSQNLSQDSKERMFKMNRLVTFSILGTIAIALIVIAALVINNSLFNAQPTQIAEQFTATPRPTATPTVKIDSPTATNTPTTIMPTATATPGPQIALPRLAQWQSGMGGGMIEPEPAGQTYVLNVPLPEGPTHMIVYLQREPEPLTASYAVQFAERLGVSGQTYQSINLATSANPDQEQIRNYLVVQGTHQTFFESSGLAYYRDLDRVPWGEGFWKQPSGVPALQDAVQTARAFLQSAGLWDDQLQIAATGNSILFYRMVNGQWPLMEPVAQVSLWSDGQVGEAMIWPLTLDTLGEYPIIPAEEAWALFQSGQFEERVCSSTTANMPAWGEWSGENPAVWNRTYANGQQAHRFGRPLVWFPTQAGTAPYVTMDTFSGLRLIGNLESLTEFVREQHAQGYGATYLYVWGQIQMVDGRPALQVEGWKATQETYWNGTIRRQGEQAMLEMYDGNTILIPDLPDDLADGTQVAVYGGQIDNRLEWHAIQEMASGPLGSESPTPIERTVEQIDLVYLTLPAGTAQDDPNARLVQPAWRFRGHTDQGQAFEIYVQAVAEEYLKNN